MEFRGVRLEICRIYLDVWPTDLSNEKKIYRRQGREGNMVCMYSLGDAGGRVGGGALDGFSAVDRRNLSEEVAYLFAYCF